MKDRFWYINTNKLFSGLPEADKNIIHSMMVPVNIRKNGLIYSQGDISDTLYILKEGRIKLNTFSEDGRELTIEILEPGDIFGEVAITGENPRETSAVALEDSFLCMIDGAAFKGFLAERSYLALKITKLVGWRLSELTNRLEEMIFHDVRTRVMHTLTSLADKYGVSVHRGRKIPIRLSHREIANLVGASRETVTLELNNLRRSGHISIEGRRIIVFS